MINLYNGDSLEILKGFESNSIDSVVTDPPYGLSFMGKDWDKALPPIEIWQECIRVLKPGGYLVAMSASRTYHRLAVQLEDLGLICHPLVGYIFGSGFPKATDLYKQFEKVYCVCDVQSEPKTEYNMRPLRGSDIQEEVSINEAEKEVMQSSMQKQSVSEHGQKGSQPEITNGKQSGMERRGDIQENQGELYRAEICEVPASISSNGQKGQLYNGAQVSDGEISTQVLNENGSGASQGPRHKKQQPGKSATIQQQRKPQICRGCGKTITSYDMNKAKGQKYGLQALKPALEPIAVFQKPWKTKGVKRMTENVIKYGVGAFNVDACRVENNKDDPNNRGNRGLGRSSGGYQQNGYVGGEVENQVKEYHLHQGRHPANLLHDGSDSVEEMFLEQGGIRKTGDLKLYENKTKEQNKMFHSKIREASHRGDTGSASRFFNKLPVSELDNPFLYTAKPSKKERNAGLEGMEVKVSGHGNLQNSKGFERFDTEPQSNHHPTVKPISLMSWLIKLVTPRCGTTLDPFMGSGTTGISAKQNNFNFIGIEREEEFFNIAKARIDNAESQTKIF